METNLNIPTAEMPKKEHQENGFLTQQRIREAGDLGDKSQSKPEKRQITRNRISYSCQTCRRRKVKCDRQHPTCGGCQKAELDCVYGNEEDFNHGNPTGDSILAYRPSAKRKPSSTSPSRPPTLDGGSGNSQPVNLRAVEQQLARLTSILENIRKDASTTSHEQPLTPVSYVSQQSGEESASSPNLRVQLPISKPAEHVAFPEHFQDAMWSLLSDEVNQLQSLTRGFGSFAVKSQTNGHACGLQMSSDQDNVQRQAEQNNNPNSFRRNSQLKQVHKSSEDCELCSHRFYDKSILLQDTWNTISSSPPAIDYAGVLHTEAKSNVLLRSWLSGVYPAFPFIPPQLVVEKHTAYWRWKNSHDAGEIPKTENPDVNFMCVMNTVWYAGVVSLSSKALHHWFPGLARATLCAHFHDQAIRHLVAISFPNHVNLSSLGSFLLLQLLPNTEEEPLQTSAYVNLIVRSAQILGLHREQAVPTLTPWETEMRRRLWWHVVQLDTSLAVTSGHPTFLSDGLYDTKMMSEIKQSLLGSKEAEQYGKDVASQLKKPDLVDEPLSEKNDSAVSVFSLFAKTSSHVALVLRKVVQTLLGTKYISRCDLRDMNQMIAEAEGQLKATVDRIQTKGLPELGFVPNQTCRSANSLIDCETQLGDTINQAEIDVYSGKSPVGLSSTLIQYHRQRISAFHKWVRITLSLMIDKLHCVAYAPFLRNAKSSFWNTARQCGLHHCHSYMRKFISLATDPSLEPFRWSWPNMHQPMHAAMIVLVDVYERPDSVEAPRSRALIDEMFALADPDNGIVGGKNGVSVQRPLRESGVEAWEMLRGLRNAGWRKVGLDTEVLWTEEDQIAVGVAQPLTEEQKIAQHVREDSLSTDKETDCAQDQRHKVAPSLSGVRHAIDLALEAFTGSKPVINQSSNHAKEQMQTQWQTNGLSKLRGQKPMPFSLHGKTTRCPNDHEDSAVLIEDNDNSSNNRLEYTGSNVPTVDLQRESDWRGSRQDQTSTLPNGLQSQGPMQNSDTGLHFNVNGSIPNATGENFKIQEHNGYVSGLQSTSESSQEQYGHSDHLGHGNYVDQQPNEEPFNSNDLGFDWERWDSVFGQYSGFTDLMDGVTWDG